MYSFQKFIVVSFPAIPYPYRNRGMEISCESTESNAYSDVERYDRKLVTPPTLPTPCNNVYFPNFSQKISHLDPSRLYSIIIENFTIKYRSEKADDFVII